jgi:hypothetical protein
MPTVIALVIGGGGGGGVNDNGGANGGGGGGAGGYQYDATHTITQKTYSITVGNGGSGHSYATGPTLGQNGGDSVFDNITATGGGGGGGVQGTTDNGANGGSGGGAGGGGPSTGGTGSQGNNGGNGGNSGNPGDGGGGGGGSGSAGAISSNMVGGNGGNGTSNSISGSALTYAGGGGGSGNGSNGTGGTGGGGYGNGSGGSVNGSANTGGGGGGAQFGSTSGNGGSGIVVISFRTDGSDGIISGSTYATGSYVKTQTGTFDIYTFTGNGTWTPTLVTLIISASETTPITESESLGIFHPLLIHDTTPVTDSFASSITTYFPQILDEVASLITSGYKWLTQTLFNTQQSLSVRPYFTAQIIDDTIQPLNDLFSGAGAIAGNGSMATAPDGKIFAVGLDGSNNLNVYRDANLDADGGVFGASTTLNTSGDTFLDSRNTYSIKISNYYKGVYRICVWYWGNFVNSSSGLNIILQYSDDGGLTWTKQTFSPASMPSNAIQNLSLAAMQPVFDSSGQMKMGVFYNKVYGTPFASGFYRYDICYIYGDTVNGFAADIAWTQAANSHDWTIHSVGSYYINGNHYCVFSGFRNILDAVGVNASYSLWSVSILNLAGDTVYDLWSSPFSIMPTGSSASTNLNQLTNPWATVVNGLVYVTVQATLVNSISQSSSGNTAQVVSTQISYMLLNSDDGQCFSYPTIFVGSDQLTIFNSGGQASFVLQNGFWWLGGGSGWLWELIQNNIVADVSTDVIGCQITDTAGQSSSINLQISNANNKWVGSSPTGPGAAAIKRNRKISIWQGYYNPDGTNAAVPHSTFYIDDINQKITGTKNDITLVGRDFYKKLTTTVSLFSFQYNGPTLFSDIFDGTFSSSWNQIAGTWNFQPGSPPQLYLTPSASESTMILQSNNGNSYGSLMRVFFANSGAGYTYIYGMYINSGNYLRLELNNTDGQSWQVVLNINGTPTVLDSGTMPFTLQFPGYHFYGVYVKRYSYFKFAFMIDSWGDPAGNTLSSYNPSTQTYMFQGTGNGEYDLSIYFQDYATLQTLFNVGFGSSASGPIIWRWFMFTTLTTQNSLGILLRKIARISGIFSFKISYLFRELLFTPNFTGTYSIKNRMLSIPPSSKTYSQNNIMSDGELSFTAKCTPVSGSSAIGFKYVFRSDESGNEYYFHVFSIGGGSNPAVFCRFERLFGAVVYNFYNALNSITNVPVLGSINIDLTKSNSFKIIAIAGWFYAYVNDVMIASWNDNNSTASFLTTGNWGFATDANTNLQVQNILSPTLWKPVQTFSINSGDDMLSDAENLAQSLTSFFFSDLLSRFKAILLNKSDPVSYNYNSQLFQQNVDQSDKEYISQVTVYGSGVMATAQATNLMAGAILRQEVIVDYTILTQADAQTRANNALTQANQYQNQYAPKQVINVGAELFDVVQIVNIGNNTSGVNGPTRAYSQTFAIGGENNNGDYSIELDTGNV